jgi:hypothetical protein
MAKMENLTVIEQEIFKFFRKSLTGPSEIKPELQKFLQKVKHLEKNRFETRAFAYLDIISWLESKVNNKTMSQVIHEKYLQSKRKQ